MRSFQYAMLPYPPPSPPINDRRAPSEATSPANTDEATRQARAVDGLPTPVDPVVSASPATLFEPVTH